MVHLAKLFSSQSPKIEAISTILSKNGAIYIIWYIIFTTFNTPYNILWAFSSIDINNYDLIRISEALAAQNIAF